MAPSKNLCHTWDRKYFPLLSKILKLICKSNSVHRETWKKIAVVYNSRAREQRNPENLRKKWMEMVNSKIPTGDPHIPEHIRIAKRLFQTADKEAEIGQGEPDDDLSDGGDDETLPESTRTRTPEGVKVLDQAKRRRYTTQLEAVDSTFKQGIKCWKHILHLRFTI